jgi:hypothetical protein
MMLYDAPHYVNDEKAGKKTPPTGKKKNRIAEMYQSRLNSRK